MYGLNTFQLIKRIILPASMPSFLVGMRSGLGLGWMFVVAAELMGASQGLGFLLTFGQNMAQPETILASIILFAIIGKFTDWILKKNRNKITSLAGSHGTITGRNDGLEFSFTKGKSYI